MADKQDAVAKLLELDPKNYWGILGLPPASDKELVRKKFKTLAIQIHPDKSTHPEATKAFQRLHDAYLALTNAVEAPASAGVAAERDTNYWTAFWRNFYDKKPYSKGKKRPPKKKPSAPKRPAPEEAAANRAYQETQQKAKAEAERKRAEKEKMKQSPFFAGLREVKSERSANPTV